MCIVYLDQCNSVALTKYLHVYLKILIARAFELYIVNSVHIIISLLCEFYVSCIVCTQLPGEIVL